MKDLSMKVSMKCSVCGNDQFSAVDETIDDLFNASDNTEIKCGDCGRITTKEQLIEDNEHIINANLEDFKEEVANEIKKDFQKKLENKFRGKNGITFKF